MWLHHPLWCFAWWVRGLLRTHRQ
jgi:peptidoglycan biosynthesis protein MviN/MurJ (putative lipid II flippase)